MADRVFILQEVHGHPTYRAVIITPESVQNDDMIIAWSHALRYTAKGLDVPDYEAALASMTQRHPTWHIGSHPIINITYDASKADIDDKGQ
jgi:hypothetical protein